MSEEGNQILSDSSGSRRLSIDGLLVCGSKYRLHGEYFAAGPFPGIPKIHHFGDCDTHNVLVMELLGPSLEKVFRECEHKFSVSTTVRLGIQLIDLMEHIHSRRLIFRNVKPENFCLGRPNTPMANQLFLIGLIHSNIYENDDHQHIPKIKGLPFAGTPRYMSLRAHKGKEQSRRDDLESIGHMLIYFMKGHLPWQGLTASNDSEKYDKIYRAKKSVELEQLCDQLPQQFFHYMLYVRTLKFRCEPNYKYLRTLFLKLINRMGVQMGDNYDWDTRRGTSSTFSVYSTSPNSLITNNYQKIGFKKSVSFDMNNNTIK